MIPDPKAGPIVAQVFEKRAAGEPWSSLARFLDEKLPRENGLRWRGASVRHVLNSPAYIGRLERTVGGERIVVADAHEPLVSRSLWEAANTSKGQGPKHRAEPAMLAGIARCAACGGLLTRGGGKKQNGVQYDSYLCSARCDAPTRISLPLLDSHVLTLIEQRHAVSDAVDGAQRTADERVAELERELEHDEAEHAAFLRIVSVLDEGDVAAATAARERYEAILAKRKRLAELTAQSQAAGRRHTDLLGWLSSDEATDGKRNLILRDYIASVVVSRSGQPGRRGDLSERVRVTYIEDALEGAAGASDRLSGERSRVAA
jgi:Recombinase